MGKKHYPKSASATSRWLHSCQQSIRLASVAPEFDSDESIEGTNAHDVMEQALASNKPASELTDDAEVAEAVQMHLDEVQKVRDAAKSIIVEKTEETMVHTAIEDFGGTPDHFIIYADHDSNIVLHVFDYKHGVGKSVSAVENDQILSYFSIIASNYLGSFDRYDATVVQPRSYLQGHRVTHWTCDHDRVKQHGENVQAVDPEAGSWEMGPWCHFCPAATVCEKATNAALAAAEADIRDIRDNTEELLKIRKASTAIKELLKNVERALVDKHRHEPIPGMKVVETLSNRKWKFSDDDLKKYFRKLRVPKKLWVRKTEKMKTAPQLLADLDSELAERVESEAVERVVTGHKLVPESAGGKPAEFVNVVDIFTEV